MKPNTVKFWIIAMPVLSVGVSLASIEFQVVRAKRLEHQLNAAVAQLKVLHPEMASKRSEAGHGH